MSIGVVSRPHATVGAFLIGVMAIAIGFALVTVDKWFFDALDPGAFDPASTPLPPDYTNPASWAALPTLEDGAVVFLPELPALDQSSAPADWHLPGVPRSVARVPRYRVGI